MRYLHLRGGPTIREILARDENPGKVFSPIPCADLAAFNHIAAHNIVNHGFISPTIGKYGQPHPEPIDFARFGTE